MAAKLVIHLHLLACDLDVGLHLLALDCDLGFGLGKRWIWALLLPLLLHGLVELRTLVEEFARILEARHLGDLAQGVHVLTDGYDGVVGTESLK